MGYAKIYNLYQDQRILAFAECFAMEKVHGTSAHVRLRDGKLQFFSGGVQMAAFQALFNHAELQERLQLLSNIYGGKDITVFGEAFGGKCQGFSHTYGPNLRFVAFDVEIGTAAEEERRVFLDVVSAHSGVTNVVCLRFVRFARIKTDMAAIDAERDRFSYEAELVGIPEKFGEGVILRPIQEVRDHRGNRICAKHKRPEFTETKTVRTVEQSAERLDAQLKDDKLAAEWVTDMRMVHVLDKLRAAGLALTPKDTGEVIKAMEADVMAESAGLGAEWSHTALRALRSLTVKVYNRNMPKVML